MMPRFSGPAMLLLLALAAPRLAAQQMTVLVNPASLTINEDLEVVFQLENLQGAVPVFPDFAGFDKRSGPTRRSSMKMADGQVVNVTSFSFILKPLKSGKLTIQPARAALNGASYATQPVEVDVAMPGAGGRSAELRDLVFLRAIPARSEVFEGEQFLVSYKVYRRISTQNQFNPLRTAANEGFWEENIPVRNPVWTRERYRGQEYETTVVKQDALFAQRNGQLFIDSLILGCRVSLPAPGRNTNIFNQFVPATEEVYYTFGNARVPIQVNPLPAAGRPADFSGLAGQFTFDARLSASEAQTGSPIQLTVRIAGKGNIQKINPLDLKLPEDWELYDPEIRDSISRSPAGISGWRTFTYTLVPLSPGEFRLPELRFSFFDLNARRYTELKSSALQVRVSGTARRRADTLAGAPAPRELLPLEPGVRVAPAGSSFAASAGYAALMAAPLLIFGLLAARRRQLDREAADQAGTRSRKAESAAQRQLAAALALLEQQRARDFYAEIARTIWQYLSHKFNLGASAHRRELAAELLRGRGASDALVQQLHSLLDACELAAFAPVSAGPEARSAYDQALTLITDLEALLEPA